MGGKPQYITVYSQESTKRVHSTILDGDHNYSNLFLFTFIVITAVKPLFSVGPVARRHRPPAATPRHAKFIKT
jgi:hypothetical protein